MSEEELPNSASRAPALKASYAECERPDAGEQQCLKKVDEASERRLSPDKHRPTQRVPFSFRPLSPKDWQLYRDIRLATHADFGDSELLRTESFHKDDYWQNELSDSSSKRFGLFHGDQIAGMTEISTKESVCVPFYEFTGSYILKEFRNRKLGDLLHQGRLDYLRENIDGQAKVLTKIWHENIASQKVAERNGFLYRETIMEGECPYRVYTRDLHNELPSRRPAIGFPAP